MIDLPHTARSLFSEGKGILAADESTKTADKRLSDYGIKPGPKMRLLYRDLFLAAPKIENYLSGVILHEETLSEASLSGTPFPKLLLDRGILPGIKVDEGTEPIPESPDEVITKGLLGLSKRLHGYREKHQTAFTKWRAVIKIEGDHLPTVGTIVENAKRLAMSSRCVQEAGMVPIVEPEVLYDGTHSRIRSQEVVVKTLGALIQAMDEHGVDLEGVVVKTAMALSGKDNKKQDTPEEVAESTVGALLSALPKTIGGIVFLSGGQTPDQATENLRAISKEAKKQRAPWPLTFSYARALQEEALGVWKGKEETVEAAREIFLERLKKVSEALTA